MLSTDQANWTECDFSLLARFLNCRKNLCSLARGVSFMTSSMCSIRLSISTFSMLMTQLCHSRKRSVI